MKHLIYVVHSPMCCRTPPGVRELKPTAKLNTHITWVSRTPPGVRELKRACATHCSPMYCRTPPGVRELKLVASVNFMRLSSRTPPGVRELKLIFRLAVGEIGRVAPLPGCVN